MGIGLAESVAERWEGTMAICLVVMMVYKKVDMTAGLKDILKAF